MVQAHPGDIAVVTGTNIACSIGRNARTSKPYIACFIVYSNYSPRPHTYAVLAMDTAEGVLRTGANEQQTSTLYSKANP